MFLGWFTENLRGQVPAPWLQVVLALAAVVCGAIVGAERERREKPAGLRTMVLICLGSTSFTIASFAFSTTTADSGRVAAQIVTGIGFLGAGTILHSAGVVRGMTTAATIWATAATGMIVGIGYVGAGLALSLLVRLVLSAALAIELHGMGNARDSRIELIFESHGGKTRIRLEKIMDDFHLKTPMPGGEPMSDGLMRVTLQCRLPQRHLRDFLNEVAKMPEVKGVAESAN